MVFHLTVSVADGENFVRGDLSEEEDILLIVPHTLRAPSAFVFSSVSCSNLCRTTTLILERLLWQIR